MRFVANKLGRLLTLGRIFSAQTFKLSPAIAPSTTMCTKAHKLCMVCIIIST